LDVNSVSSGNVYDIGLLSFNGLDIYLFHSCRTNNCTTIIMKLIKN
ncbi:unnamed protein product, partial [Rotaria sp. Silwood2]